VKLRNSLIPNGFTLLNMAAGFTALILISHAHYISAMWLIVLAALFDWVDGALARALHFTSDFGAQLDSLADLISFGAAPAFLANALYFQTHDIMGIALSLCPLLFGALRLARYNVLNAREHRPYFTGLPIPMGALALAAFPLFLLAVSGDPGHGKYFFPYMLIVSLLMVSHVPYQRIPRIRSRDLRRHPVRTVLAAAGALLLVAFPARSLFFLSTFYILSGIIRWMTGIERERIVKPLTH